MGQVLRWDKGNGAFLHVLKLYHVYYHLSGEKIIIKIRPSHNLPIPYITIFPEFINHVARFIWKLLYRNTEMEKKKGIISHGKLNTRSKLIFLSSLYVVWNSLIQCYRRYLRFLYENQNFVKNWLICWPV